MEPQPTATTEPATLSNNDGPVQDVVPAAVQFPATPEEFQRLTFAQRIDIAQAALARLRAGTLARVDGFSPALSLVRSVPVDAPEWADAQSIAASLQEFRPSVDETVASTPPEQRLDAALYILKQAAANPVRSDLVDAAEKFAAIPADLSVDEEKLRIVTNAIAILRAGPGGDAVVRPEKAEDVAAAPPPLDSGCGGCPDPTSPKTVHVKAYTRRDGTQVREHYRTPPRR